MGLDAAGKTTILYKLKLGEIVTTIPTIGKEQLTLELVLLDISIPLNSQVLKQAIETCLIFCKRDSFQVSMSKL